MCHSCPLSQPPAPKASIFGASASGSTNQPSNLFKAPASATSTFGAPDNSSNPFKAPVHKMTSSFGSPEKSSNLFNPPTSGSSILSASGQSIKSAPPSTFGSSDQPSNLFKAPPPATTFRTSNIFTAASSSEAKTEQPSTNLFKATDSSTSSTFGTTSNPFKAPPAVFSGQKVFGDAAKTPHQLPRPDLFGTPTPPKPGLFSGSTTETVSTDTKKDKGAFKNPFAESIQPLGGSKPFGKTTTFYHFMNFPSVFVQNNFLLF